MAASNFFDIQQIKTFNRRGDTNKLSSFWGRMEKTLELFRGQEIFDTLHDTGEAFIEAVL